ncbi:MAG: sodium:solute symporter, partial [Candidatus Krumholzibacteria bacterium]|nr:sodium:solute symporter [Candidatus Krumholzibacteria bacterium]
MTMLQACIAVLFVYIGVLMGIGLWTQRRTQSASDFILGGRTIGPWVTALPFIAVYFSSVLIIGGGAFGYMYGMATIWVG